MMYVQLKKIRDRLMNSLVFLSLLCIVIGFVLCAIVMVQIPQYIDALKRKKWDAERLELTQTLDTLRECYADNSREFYVTYLDSPFYDLKDTDIPLEEYTDEYIHMYTMNQYFDTFVRPALADNDDATVSTEISTFIQIYGGDLIDDSELKKVMDERDVLHNEIADVMSKLDAIPK